MKIYIIGGPGSGKTTYAKKLSQKLNIPHFDLDEIKWMKENGKIKYNQRRSPEERSTLLNNILTQHRDWICEGVYFQDWINPIIEQSDKIIILKPSVWIRQYRVIKRSFLRIFHPDPEESLISIYKLITWSHFYEKKYLPIVMEKILKAEKNYHIIQRRKP